MEILGAEVLDYNIQITMKNYEQVEQVEENEGVPIGAIIGGILGGIVVIGGSYAGYKYYKKRKTTVAGKYMKRAENYKLSKNPDASSMMENMNKTENKNLESENVLNETVKEDQELPIEEIEKKEDDFKGLGAVKEEEEPKGNGA